MREKSDIGVIGLAVMGENLIRNMASKGYTVTAYNRSLNKVESFLAGRACGKNIRGARSIEELVDSLAKPRKIMIVVKADMAVDDLIDQLLPLLDSRDSIIDGGNTHYQDTNRRTTYVESKGLYYVGTGVSGGEEGALTGPSIMPGGSHEAWNQVKPIFQDIAAKVGDGTACCDWVGEAGAGHFVKTVHNGIEYGDMQLICEAYQLMKDLLRMSHDDMHDVFAAWNDAESSSYLIEITRDILAYREDGVPLVEKILDKAGQKGTGKWAGITALELGIPLTLIIEAVSARSLSAQLDERVVASRILTGPEVSFDGDKEALIDDLRQTVMAAKVVSYAQGYALMREAAKEFGWKLNYGGIGLIWRGSCIIRSSFLDMIKQAYDADPELSNLPLNDYFANKVKTAQSAWRRVIAVAAANGIPTPAISAGLNYFDGYRCARLPANLLQAQRDYFGAHTYERIDKKRGEYFHTNWTGRGGDTAASTYDV